MQERPRHGAWGDVLVAGCACLLTVSILGSAVYLGWRLYDRYQWTRHARTFVLSLENRTAEELTERAAQLRARPKVARYVLPEILRGLSTAVSERQLCATIQISRAFVDDKRIRRALTRLVRDNREIVAAAAVEALAEVRPREQSAAILGGCLTNQGDSPLAPAAVDRICAGLLDAGEAGRQALSNKLALLAPDRRVWLVGFVAEGDAPDRQAWLDVLAADPDERVQAAVAAIRGSRDEQDEQPGAARAVLIN